MVGEGFGDGVLDEQAAKSFDVGLEGLPPGGGEGGAASTGRSASPISGVDAVVLHIAERRAIAFGRPADLALGGGSAAVEIEVADLRKVLRSHEVVERVPRVQGVAP